MNLGKWISLFLSTLGIGIGAALVVGAFVFMINPEVTPSTMGVEGILFNVIQTVTVGALLGAFSHMGFFAYLTVNLFAQGIFKNKLLWTYVQVFFIVVVSGYAAMLRVPEGENMLPYFVLPGLVVIGGYFVARRKAAETNRKSFVPTMFFMTAVTLLEAVPALQQFNAYGTVMMVLPLFLCNAWQILRLHKILTPVATGEPAGRAS
ncbi:KinB signaling pathway activation protein [Paenibacillus antri]|uniref:KinB signaling pathway activation protein n=1 Tax=Paenibacillus antri TaxID=2582848 RepID=A0A5R9FWC9_9BACL|nr:KinB-signaling pathway activation protein [Paenibacillus antri]TLS48382.1 KinB signaling pathway activation protein [Paenibacillus antri]